MEQSFNTVVDMNSVARQFTDMAAVYQSAQPFPHMSKNGVFDEQVLRHVAAEFPDPSKMAGHFAGEIEGGKHTESDWSKFGPVTQAFVSACNSGPFMHALSALTGIKGCCQIRTSQVVVSTRRGAEVV